MAAEPPVPPRQRPWPLIVGIAALVLLGPGLFLAVWMFLAPAERKVVVAYSDFVTEVRAGRVEEIHIRGRDITYRMKDRGDGRPTVKATVGPIPDQALVESLKPDDPNAPLPKIIFEK